MLSSVSGVVCLRGQAHLSAKNTFVNGLARSRVSRGQKVVPLDLGAMTEDGLLSEESRFLTGSSSTGLSQEVPESNSLQSSTITTTQIYLN